MAASEGSTPQELRRRNLAAIPLKRFADASDGGTVVTWEGHYTEHGLAAAQVDAMLIDFYALFLDAIEKAHASGLRPGQSPY